ncbi:MAG: outer membrane protein assembly factor BamE [Rhodospirillales bacterium]|nr:outer membrane protein assembly factor BamE [Rhodospirillales bacterium]
MIERIHRISQITAVGALVVVLAACAPRIEMRGNLPDLDRISEIKPGEQSRQEVSETLGSPSNVNLFDKEVWYYISERTETLAFLAPEIQERKIVAISFDEKGVVSDVKTYGLEKGRNIVPVDRETPTSGNEMTFIQQLFGNFGRFNKEVPAE